jgi:hypothetical protein
LGEGLNSHGAVVNAIYVPRFFFDAGSGVCFWSGNDPTGPGRWTQDCWGDFNDRVRQFVVAARCVLGPELELRNEHRS